MVPPRARSVARVVASTAFGAMRLAEAPFASAARKGRKRCAAVKLEGARRWRTSTSTPTAHPVIATSPNPTGGQRLGERRAGNPQPKRQIVGDAKAWRCRAFCVVVEGVMKASTTTSQKRCRTTRLGASPNARAVRIRKHSRPVGAPALVKRYDDSPSESRRGHTSARKPHPHLPDRRTNLPPKV